MKNQQKPRWAVALGILVLLYIGGSFWNDWRIEKRAREDCLARLRALSPAAQVTIDGESRQAPAILESLKGLQHIDAHHSSSQNPRRVEIRDAGSTIQLVVAQDSTRPSEYWVYRPGPNHFNDPLGEPLGAFYSERFGDTGAVQP